MATNSIVTIKYGELATKPIFQWDYGQTLKFDGFGDFLPDVGFEVHFANPADSTSVTSIGTADGVQIPDALLQTGLSVIVWVYLHDTATDGETEYRFTIPVARRTMPDNGEITPEQADIIDQAMAVLQSGITRAEAAAEIAETSATASELSATDAATSAAAAAGSASDAYGDAERAEISAGSAEGFAHDAQESEGAAQGYAADASASAGAAAQSASDASDSADRAEQIVGSLSASTGATLVGAVRDGVTTVQGAIDGIDGDLDKTLLVRETLQSGTNLNDLVNTGIYLGADGRTYENLPAGYGSAFRLTVIRTPSGNVSQIYSLWVGGHEIVRNRTAGNWGEWRSSDVFVPNTVLASNADLNALLPNTIRRGISGRTYLNSPTTDGFVVETISVDSTVSQILTTISDGIVYARHYDSAWSSWARDMNVFRNYGGLPSGTNLDDVLVSGVYGGSSGSTYSNLPEGESSVFLLFVNKSATSGNVTQIYRRWSDGLEYTRNKVGSNAFGAWASYEKTLALASETFYSGGSITTGTDLNTVKTSGVFGGTSSGVYTNRPSGETGAFLLFVNVSQSSGNTTQIYRRWAGGLEYTRNYIRNSGNWGAWSSYEKNTNDALTANQAADDRDRSLKILFIGNSYTDDCVAYAPYIIRNISPDIKLTIANLYISGANFTDWQNAWTNNTAVSYYKITPTGAAWASAASKTVKAALHDEQWDIIALQNSATKDPVYGSKWTLGVTLLDEIVDYVATDATGYTGHAVKAGYLAPQIRYESGTPTGTFADVMALVNQFIEDSACAFVIPCTAAVENARGTTLASYGAAGDLCYDENGHMQEGIGCLCASYCTALKILEIMGIGKSGVLGESTRPTDAWLTEKNIPQKHGSSVGITEENCRIAQKCAIQAVKFPDTVSTII